MDPGLLGGTRRQSKRGARVGERKGQCNSANAFKEQEKWTVGEKRVSNIWGWGEAKSLKSAELDRRTGPGRRQQCEYNVARKKKKLSVCEGARGGGQAEVGNFDGYSCPHGGGGHSRWQVEKGQKGR